MSCPKNGDVPNSPLLPIGSPGAIGTPNTLEPRRLLSSTPFQSSSGECRFNRLGGIHGGKKNAPDDSGAITFSGTFSGTLVGARSGAGAGAGAGVWAGFGTVSGMSIGVEPG